MGELRNNIYWVTETEDYQNYIGMNVPYRELWYQSRCCFPRYINRCCPKRNDCIEIDMSNNIEVRAESSADIEDNEINNSTIGDITGGTATTTVGVDAVQVSVLVVVPIIDSFDTDAIPLPGNGPVAAASRNYRVGAGGQNLDIQVNGDGTATVNGVPAEQSELADGTKVYIYRNNEQKKVEKAAGK